MSYIRTILRIKIGGRLTDITSGKSSIVEEIPSCENATKEWEGTTRTSFWLRGGNFSQAWWDTNWRTSATAAKLQDRRGGIEDETAEKAPPNHLEFVERENV
jgi:hypothetical protein